MESSSEPPPSQPNVDQLSRRSLLQLAAGTAIANVLTGCQSPPSLLVAPTPTSTPASAPAAVAAPAAPPVEPTPAADYLAMVGSDTHIIFDLCIRDGACVEVCPVECIVPGQPPDEWPWYYVDPDTCIACGACVPECPVGAVLPARDLPPEYLPAIERNVLFFTDGPGYAALDMG